MPRGGSGLRAPTMAVQAFIAVCLLGGAAATLLQGRGALQDIDQTSMFEGVCKDCFRVQRVRDIVPTLRKAFQLAASGVPGPGQSVNFCNFFNFVFLYFYLYLKRH